MTENQILVLFLVLIYLSECAAWVNSKAFVFQFTKLNSGRINKPGAGLGNDRGRLCLSHPLPFLAGLHVVPGSAQNMDVAAATSRWTEFRNGTKTLGLASHVSFGMLFIVVPLVWWKAGADTLEMLITFALLLLISAVTAMLYFRAHRKFYPADPGSRWQHSLLIALVPTHTSRARDTLGRDLLKEFHPLAIGKLALPESGFESLANQLLRETKFPVSPKTANATALETIQAFMEQNQVKELLPTKLADATQYCPRCHAQFEAHAECCQDCGGMKLLPLE